MKKIALTLALASSLSAASVYAAEPNSFYVGVEGSFAMPNKIKATSEFGNLPEIKNKNTGAIGVNFGYNIADNFRADAGFTYVIPAKAETTKSREETKSVSKELTDAATAAKKALDDATKALADAKTASKAAAEIKTLEDALAAAQKTSDEAAAKATTKSTLNDTYKVQTTAMAILAGVEFDFLDMGDVKLSAGAGVGYARLGAKIDNTVGAADGVTGVVTKYEFKNKSNVAFSGHVMVSGVVFERTTAYLKYSYKSFGKYGVLVKEGEKEVKDSTKKLDQSFDSQTITAGLRLEF